MEKTAALAALAALGQETRLDVFRLLLRQGAEGLPAGEIAERLGVVQNTMSAHLAILARGGLVRAHRSGRSISYRADLDGIGALIRYLLEDCCGGRPEICAPLLAVVSCGCAPTPRKTEAVR